MYLLKVSSLVLAFQGSVQAAISCTSTADCAAGETCVAGDSDTMVQACVPSTVCGGSSLGNCPSDDSVKLACLWRPHHDCSAGCAVLHGEKGIYKCVSLARCDAYYGGTSCSGGCSSNGVRCNGRGSCNMMSLNSDGTPNFSCTCENGYQGEKCEAPIGTNATKVPSKHSFSFQDDDLGSSNSSSMNGLTHNDSSSSSDVSDHTSVDDGHSSKKSNSSAAGDIGPVVGTSHHGVRSRVLVILAIAALFIFTMVLLAMFCHRQDKKKQEEEFATALASDQGVGMVGLRDLAAGHTGYTPRSKNYGR